jgi:hypothetical protein
VTNREKILVRQVEEYAFKVMWLADWVGTVENERLQTTVWSPSLDSILSDADDAWYEEELGRHAH